MRHIENLAVWLAMACSSATALAHDTVPAPPRDAPLLPYVLSYALGGGVAVALQWTYIATFRRRRNAKERELKAIIDTAPVALIISDRRHRIIDWNDQAEQIFGWKREDALGNNLFHLLVPMSDRLKACNEAAAIFDGKVVSCSTDTNLTHPGGSIVCEWRRSVLLNDAARPYAMLSIAMDVTERSRMETRLKQMAHTDALTGIPNRALLFERLRQAIALAKRQGRILALLFVDIDHFKRINDTYGHEAGDAVLCTVAQRLCDLVRQSDTVARIGGDEFVVLLNDVGGNAAIDMMAGKIAADLARPIAWDATELSVAASIGIARYHVDGIDAESLMRAADRAMYSRKKLQMMIAVPAR